MLDTASYGAYAMDMHRRILFWNRSAERIVGHEAGHVVGRQCYEVLYGLPEQPSVPACGGGCLTLHLAESRRIAPVTHVPDALCIGRAEAGCGYDVDHAWLFDGPARAGAPFS